MWRAGATSLQIYVQPLPASLREEEGRNPLESVRHRSPCPGVPSPNRDGRTLSARRSTVLGRSLPVLRVCGVSLAQPSLCPELDSPVTVLA